MRVSQRFLNFAASIAFVAALLLLSACKGRTTANMTPDGDTIEVVVNQPSLTDTLISN